MFYTNSSVYSSRFSTMIKRLSWAQQTSIHVKVLLISPHFESAWCERISVRMFVQVQACTCNSMLSDNAPHAYASHSFEVRWNQQYAWNRHSYTCTLLFILTNQDRKPNTIFSFSVYWRTVEQVPIYLSIFLSLVAITLVTTSFLLSLLYSYLHIPTCIYVVTRSYSSHTILCALVMSIYPSQRRSDMVELY